MRTYAVLLCTLLAAVVRAAEPSPDEIERQITLLGSDNFRQREEAEAALMKFGVSAEPFLRSAEKSNDAEVHIRATRVLSRLAWEIGSKKETDWLTSLGPVLGTSRFGDPVTAASKAQPDKEPKNERDAALSWLARAQEADGHWDSQKFGAATEADIEQTALALLVFLGAGHTEKVGDYKQHVKDAVAWLRQHQRDDGAFVMDGKPVNPVAHALTGLAMAEAAGMAPRLESTTSAEKAVAYTIEKLQRQTAAGLSGFSRAENFEPDLLTTLFFSMQLKSAKVAGLTFPTLPVEGIKRFLSTCQSADGKGYSFIPGQDPSPRATFTACLIGVFVGNDHAVLRPAVVNAFQRFRPAADDKSPDTLMTYLGSLTVFTLGVTEEGDQNLWIPWIDPLRERLTRTQIKDGKNAGSWDPSGPWASGGRVLTTALNGLCLEIYYRYQQLSKD